MILSKMRRIGRALTTAQPAYLLRRLFSEMRRLFYDRLGFWGRVSRHVNRRICVAALTDPNVALGGLLADDAAEASRRLLGEGELRRAFEGRAVEARHRRLSFFGSAISADGPWPWLGDWKHGHEWPIGPAGAIDHFVERSVPYDPKLPFELSRLAFVVHLFAAALVTESDDVRQDFQDFALAVLGDWEIHNPLGESVNWYAMEASVRALALAQALDLARLGSVGVEGQVQIARLLAKCAYYVEINIERAIESNNHLIGNLTCLAVAGFALRGVYPEGRRWFELARRDLPRELERQFHADGGNFEGSLPYHLATTDLMLLADLAFERAGCPMPPAQRARLRDACLFAAGSAGLDGKVPIVGDCDDSRHFLFDLVEPLDAGNLEAFSVARFGAPGRVGRPEALLSTAFLLGVAAVETALLAEHRAPDVARLYPDTGVIVVRTKQAFLFQDVGGVGQNGHGGHGHNDLSSFVFSFSGRPILVDRGSGVYTADPACRDRQRSSSAHSLLTLDDTEIADLGPTLFQIQNQALPQSATLEYHMGCWRTHVAHTGYSRLHPPARTERSLRLDPISGILECEDIVRSSVTRSITRRFHFDPDINLLLVGPDQAASFDLGGQAWRAAWDNSSQARIEYVDHFYGYGQSVLAPCLVLTGEGADQELWFTIQPLKCYSGARIS